MTERRVTPHSIALVFLNSLRDPVHSMVETFNTRNQVPKLVMYNGKLYTLTDATDITATYIETPPHFIGDKPDGLAN